MAVAADSHRSFLIPEQYRHTEQKNSPQYARQRIFIAKILMNRVILLCKLIISPFSNKINIFFQFSSENSCFCFHCLLDNNLLVQYKRSP